MEDEDFERPKPSKRLLILVFSLFLTIAYLAYTFAATITINANNRIEFGQGVYNLRVCDDFININLGATSVDQGGTSKVNRLIINGFDSMKCKNRNFTIKIFKANSETPADLFNIASPNKANRVKITVSATGAVTLINMADQNVGTGDSYHSIAYASGVYTITFVDPLLPVPDVSRTTIESANNPDMAT